VARSGFLLTVATLVGLGACASGAPSPTSSPPPATIEPVAAYFTAEQATRGQRVFTSICSTCHGRNEFTGPIFALTWRADPVGNLYEHVSTNMPQDDPGSLEPQQYADVIAYILQLNGITPGDRELPPDAQLLAAMQW
jgi:mono/diheme cytochrome c family protein